MKNEKMKMKMEMKMEMFVILLSKIDNNILFGLVKI